MTKQIQPNMSLRDLLDVLRMRIEQIEGKFSEIGYTTKTFVQSEIKTRWKVPAQATTLFGIHTAICVDTFDPWGQNRVRWFSPHLLDPSTTILQLPFATPVSAMGGFDDCGLSWVPPAGSKLVLVFEGGNRNKAFYLGTTWDCDIGPTGDHSWNYAGMKEYLEMFEGKRDGYLSGKNDGSQNFPPWNTSQYNYPDIDDISTYRDDPDAPSKVTWPHIYGFKTPQRHMVVLDDGNYKCNHRWSRVEIKSGGGGCLIFKDDHLHPSGQWLHPNCQCESSGDVTECHQAGEYNDKGTPTANSSYQQEPTCANIYHKHESECKPYRGVGTPQNNKIDLPQTGFQIISPSGHTLYANDEVEQPIEEPADWYRGVRPFNFGETDKCLCETGWISTTGHKIWMNDVESDTNIRSEENGIFIETATGHYLKFNDHTISCGQGGAQAGKQRGIWMGSTSEHTFEMADVDNLQCSPERKEGGIPDNSATQAYVKLRTGYGLELMMEDADTQEKECQRQYIRLFCPQYNVCSGPHFIRMQEDPAGGQIQVRAGGDYFLSTSGDYYAVIGADDVSAPTGFNAPLNQGNIPTEWSEFCAGGCLGPRNWITVASRNSFHASCEIYFNVADTHYFLADEAIYLLAGDDAETPDGCGPSIWPVLVLQGSRVVASTRVRASCRNDDFVVSIFNLQPFQSGAPLPPCSQ